MAKEKSNKGSQKAEQKAVEKSKKMSTAELKQLVNNAVNAAKNNGYSSDKIKAGLRAAVLGLNITPNKDKKGLLTVTLLLAVVVIMISVVLSFSTNITPASLYDFMKSQDCLVPTNLLVTEAGRPISDCDMCRGLQSVPVSTNMTKDIFLQSYAYSGKPVLIQQATSDWLALRDFDFYFFRELYAKYPNSADVVEKHCNFLRYQTEFVTFSDFLQMDDDRVKSLDWYVGWSNCDRRVMKELRKYYQRPFFLPDDSVSSTLDWIFIGGAGPGAGLHIDVVDTPSWQAQIKGEKVWTLVPPYECEHECREFNVTVKQGDIIVLDTNLWFHRTEVSEGDMSITIGSEYD